MSNRLIPKTNNPEADRVYTPSELAKNIIGHYKPQGLVLDPCRGKGAFFEALPEGRRDWCELDEGKDFLAYSRKIDWILTNPPWSKMRDFLCHGMSLADNVVYLAPLTHFITKARLRDMKTAGFGLREAYCVEYPKSWPKTGLQLAAVHLQRGYDGGWLFTGEPGY